MDFAIYIETLEPLMPLWHVDSRHIRTMKNYEDPIFDEEYWVNPKSKRKFSYIPID